MSFKIQKNLILEVIEYAISKDVFTLKELDNDLEKYRRHMPFIRNTLIAYKANETNPNHIITLAEPKYSNQVYTTPDYEISKFRILPSALFSYIDHTEIIQAREAARESKRLAWIAIMISTIIGLASIIIQIAYAK